MESPARFEPVPDASGGAARPAGGALLASASTPAWAASASPFGCAWAEVIEHREWFDEYPAVAPVEHASLLGLLALRRAPARLPAVLSRGPDRRLDTPLYRVMDAGPDAVLERLGRFERAEVLQALAAALDAGPEGGLARAAEDPEGAPSEPSAALAALLSPAADSLRPRLLRAAARLTRRRFGRARALYAPIYLSSACTNRCSYCGFRHDNDFERLTLDAAELEREMAVLRRRGFDSVLLLTGEAPRVASVDYLAERVREARAVFPHVSVEVFPLARDEYARLREAGVELVTLYQETYDPATYRRVHEAGRKRDLLYRLGAPERVLASGIERLGLGALLGLAPFRFEALALGLHARELLTRYPRARLALSFPRLRAAEGAEAPAHPVSDAELVHVMSALRLWLPEVEFVLSTREPAALRDALSPLLVTRLSAGSSTEPGGYARAETASALAQFSLSDERPADAVRRALERRGLLPVG